MSAVAKSRGSLAVGTRVDQSVVTLTVDGALGRDAVTALQHSIAEATADRPAAVIVDVNGAVAPVESAWAALVGAHWQDNTRPDVPVVLVCSSRQARDAITRSGITRVMPVYTNVTGAKKGIARLARRDVRYARAELPATLASLRESRRLVREWLTAWSRPSLIPVALVVVNVFLENVLEHTGSDPVVRIECDGSTATIAVSDGSRAPAVQLPSPPKGIDVSGLAIVSALCRGWGSASTASGKTVWAIIGPENQL